jgi:uncharacterized protein YacL
MPNVPQKPGEAGASLAPLLPQSTVQPLAALVEGGLHRDHADQPRPRVEQVQRLFVIRVVRLVFAILIVTFTTIAFYQAWSLSKESNQVFWVPVAIAALIIIVVVGIDKLTPVKRISSIVGVVVGLLFGLLAAVVLGALGDLLLQSWTTKEAFDQYAPMIQSIKIIVGICLGYLGVVTVLQTQDDFRLVIPYIEFAKQIRGVRPILLDSSALIDGRIVDIASTRFIQAPLVVPQFVVKELQTLADSAEPMKRTKGRRGLDMITRLQRQATVDVSVDETPVAQNAVDQMLVDLARAMPAMILTTDVALARVAGIQGALALNLNDLANAAKINLAPGEMLSVKVLREGEQDGQGVGYMPDGTMIVLEDGEEFLGEQVEAVVTSSLQTSAGRLIFARIGTDAPRRTDAPSERPIGRGGAHAPTTGPSPSPNSGLSRGSSPSMMPGSSPASPRVAAPAPESIQAPATTDSPDQTGAARDTSIAIEPSPPSASVTTDDPQRIAARSPHPPRSPASLRQGTPRNPRR